MSNELVELVIIEAKEKMNDAVAAARREFATVRTGRANSALLERVPVDAYGVTMTLQELASFSVPEVRQLLITPHDAANITAIERSIMHSRLGLSPSSDGRVLRIMFPPLTGQRRKELVKLVGSMAEDSRNQIRALRRAARKELDEIEKDGGISSDDIARASSNIDSVARAHENLVDEAQASKEKELLEV